MAYTTFKSAYASKVNEEFCMLRVAVLAVDNSPLSSLALPVDIFNAAGVLYNRIAGIAERPYFKVQVVSPTGRNVSSLKSVPLIPDGSLEELPDPDIMIVGALGNVADVDRVCSEVGEKLVSLYRRGTVLASICTGAFLLASTGLLDGKEATTHWGLCRAFASRFPKVMVKSSRTVVDQQNLLTSGGTTAGGDLALYMVRKYCGSNIADQCARVLLLDPFRSTQLPYEVMTVPVDHGDSKVAMVQEWVGENSHREVSVDDLAAICSMSRRTFERRFKRATGQTPLRYVQQVRIEKAKRLLEAGEATFETITAEVGYEDPSTFRRMFQKSTGLSPTVYRQRFGIRG